jgi:hypothetical protein
MSGQCIDDLAINYHVLKSLDLQGRCPVLAISAFSSGSRAESWAVLGVTCPL